MADKTFGSSAGLTILAEDTTTPANGMVAYITSSYNSGYQNGDIKGAFLSDTDDTDLVGSELVTNGTFDTDTDWTKGSGVTISGGVVNATSAAVIVEQETSLVSGKQYVATLDYTITSGAKLRIEGAGVLAISDSIAGTGSGSLALTFTANDPTFRIAADSATFTGTIDNVSVKLADADRSVNG